MEIGLCRRVGKKSYKKLEKKCLRLFIPFILVYGTMAERVAWPVSAPRPSLPPFLCTEQYRHKNANFKDKRHQMILDIYFVKYFSLNHLKNFFKLLKPKLKS